VSQILHEHADAGETPVWLEISNIGTPMTGAPNDLPVGSISLYPEAAGFLSPVASAAWSCKRVVIEI